MLTHETNRTMKKISAFFAAVLLLSAFAMADVWKSDKAHSQLGFTITHLGIADISGHFKNFEVTVNASKPDFSDAVFELSADAASIDTDIEMRDNHLRSADFFEVEKFPKITFKSTGLKPAGKDRYKLSGDLTLHGVTKPVTMDLWYRGTIENRSNKKPTSGFQLTGTIKRSDFALGNKFAPPMLSDEVRINANGEFTK